MTFVNHSFRSTTELKTKKDIIFYLSQRQTLGGATIRMPTALHSHSCSARRYRNVVCSCGGEQLEKELFAIFGE